MGRYLIWMGVAVMAMAMAVVVRPSAADDHPDHEALPAGMQVLTRGPIHEAFAVPVIFDPGPGPVVPKQPPPPIPELPPDRRPRGADVRWIPGDWGWDDRRHDFVWVSGTWREVPPGRHWVPGYWNPVEGGCQWVAGFWAPTDQRQLQYLPPPPASQEAGPTRPAPGPDFVWVPGSWCWRDARYSWRPGFWAPSQPDWLWVPDHYVWSPAGDLFVDGYWDRPLQNRGLLFAPVSFAQRLPNPPRPDFSPSVVLLTSALLSSLFVQPSDCHYYFGDYYDPDFIRSGIYPWHAFHESRHGYDPLFSYYAASSRRRDPEWVDHLREAYRFRLEHEDARPPWTLVQQVTVQRQPPHVANNLAARDLVLAVSIHQLTSLPQETSRFEPLERARRRELALQSSRLHRFRELRRAREVEAARLLPLNVTGPRWLELPRSPIAFTPHREPDSDHTPHAHPWTSPPPTLAHPEPLPNLHLRMHEEPVRRPEPHPDHLPLGSSSPSPVGAERNGHLLNVPRSDVSPRERPGP
ncbi:MAG: YXWGXW repeat-containing protein [Planctomycetaceae bacterium]|nr:YXWGXW repeat-containing protein [Planctomycetaceae bacterium]